MIHIDRCLSFTLTAVFLADMQEEMLGSAEADFRACIERATSWADFMAGLDRGNMVLAPWCVHLICCRCCCRCRHSRCRRCCCRAHAAHMESVHGPAAR